jgi:hypothetical protein
MIHHLQGTEWRLLRLRGQAPTGEERRNYSGQVPSLALRSPARDSTPAGIERGD